MADQPAGGSAPKHGIIKSTFKMAVGGVVGLATGAVAVYSHAIVDQVVKPTKPIANFAVSATEGLAVTFENHAAGESGWWDFGDGSQLEAFDPNQTAVSHKYPKPGTYTAKLIVRNFLLEENDRSVGVDLTNPPNSLPPAVTGLKVEPIREQAPATYRITGELKNADAVVWKLGDKAEHTQAQDGPFEKYVTFEKPGQYPIVLSALSNAKKDPQVVVQSVSVSAPATAVYEAMVSITESGSRVEKYTRTERVSTPTRDRSGPTRGFDKVLHAPPGRVITAARLDEKQIGNIVRNGRAEVAKDGSSVRLTGEWAASADALTKSAGGSEMTIPVLVTEERNVAEAPRHNSASGVMDASGQILVKLPPRVVRAVNANRKVEVDVGLTQPSGPRIQLAKGPLDSSGKWTAPVNLNGKQFVAQATLVNDTLRVTFANAPAK